MLHLHCRAVSTVEQTPPAFSVVRHGENYFNEVFAANVYQNPNRNVLSVVVAWRRVIALVEQVVRGPPYSPTVCVVRYRPALINSEENCQYFYSTS
jgi:hypothetical protein